MKTPREILLFRHQAAGPQLDEIRRSVVGKEIQHQRVKSELAPPGNLFSVTAVVHKLWQEVILPCNRAWAGLTALWLVLIGVHYALREPVAAGETHQEISSSLQLREALRDREQELAELFAPKEKQGNVTPDPVPSSPRSQGAANCLNI